LDNQYDSIVLWFTGLSGSGKSTLSKALFKILESKGITFRIIDGDEVRHKHPKQLSFTKEHIKKNNEIIMDICNKSRNEVEIIIVSIISPFTSDRLRAREKLSPNFYEIYCNADLNSVIKRDVKGLYKQANEGEITNMIGLSESSPYNKPESPDLELNTGMLGEGLDISIERLWTFLEKKLENIKS